MTTIISVQSTDVVQVATAPVPSSSVLTTAKDTVSVRSAGGTVSVQGQPQQTVVGSQPDTLILQVATTSVAVVSVNTGDTPGNAGILNRTISDIREVDPFETMINHDIFLEATGEIILNGTDAETAGTLFLL